MTFLQPTDNPSRIPAKQQQRQKRTRYFKTGRDRMQLKKLLEVECMTINEAAAEMQIPNYVVLCAANRYGIKFHHERTYWTAEENATLSRLFRQISLALPDKSDRQIVNRLQNIHLSKRGENT